MLVRLITINQEFREHYLVPSDSLDGWNDTFGVRIVICAEMKRIHGLCICPQQTELNCVCIHNIDKILIMLNWPAPGAEAPGGSSVVHKTR